LKETNKQKTCSDLLFLQKEMGEKEVHSFAGDLACVAGHL